MMTAQADPRPRRILLDTSVVVYVWDTAETTKRAMAQAVFDRVVDEGALVLSTQVVGEFFRAVTRGIRTPLVVDFAAAVSSRLVALAPLLSVEPAVVLEALRATVRYGLSYWDAQLWATAKLNGVGVILSEDFQDGAVIEGVRFVNPFAHHFDIDALLEEGPA
jgi:predicted nucleic acid-binding protein